jgi:protoporphyrinogen/coproporphyrinogen III oxidase
MDQNTQKHIGVIGAGIAGLTCAYELQEAGFKVTVFEKENYVGGRMSSREKDGFTFDIGADHLCNLYEQMRSYCEKFNIPWEKMRFLEYALLKNGEILPPTKAIGFVSKMRLALQYMKKRKVFDFFNLAGAVKYDTDNAYNYMKKAIGKEASDYLVDGFTSTYQFHGADEISLGAMFGILDSVQNDKAEWYLHRTKGGMIALPKAFAAKLDVHLGEAITNVETKELIEITSEKNKYQFDALVMASTPNVSRQILKDPSSAQKELLENLTHSSTISVSFRVKRDLLPNTSIVWVPEVENQIISGYVNEAMKGEELNKDGKTLIDVWLHESGAKKIINSSDEEIFSVIKSEMLKVCPWIKKEEDLENFDLQRWEYAMPKFNRGHLTRVAEFLENGQGENNIFFCGDFMNSPWTEGALRCGQRTASQISEELK